MYAISMEACQRIGRLIMQNHDGISEDDAKRAIAEICGAAMAIMVMQPFVARRCERIMECANVLMRYFYGSEEVGDEEE